MLSRDLAQRRLRLGNFFNTTHVRNQNFWNRNGAICVLVVFQNGGGNGPITVVIIDQSRLGVRIEVCYCHPGNESSPGVLGNLHSWNKSWLIGFLTESRLLSRKSSPQKSPCRQWTASWPGKVLSFCKISSALLVIFPIQHKSLPVWRISPFRLYWQLNWWRRIKPRVSRPALPASERKEDSKRWNKPVIVLGLRFHRCSSSSKGLPP